MIISVLIGEILIHPISHLLGSNYNSMVVGKGICRIAGMSALEMLNTTEVCHGGCINQGILAIYFDKGKENVFQLGLETIK